MANKKSLILSPLLLFAMFIALSGQQLNLSETMNVGGPVTIQEMQHGRKRRSFLLPPGHWPAARSPVVSITYHTGYAGNVKVLTTVQKSSIRLVRMVFLTFRRSVQTKS
jgi:hypothetical protein